MAYIKISKLWVIIKCNRCSPLLLMSVFSQPMKSCTALQALICSSIYLVGDGSSLLYVILIDIWFSQILFLHAFFTAPRTGVTYQAVFIPSGNFKPLLLVCEQYRWWVMLTSIMGLGDYMAHMWHLKALKVKTLHLGC